MRRQPEAHRFLWGDAKYVTFESVTRNRVHRHSFFEPCIVISGSGEFEHGHDIFALNRGDLFVANPGVFHEIRSISTKDLRLYFLAFAVFSAHSAKSLEAAPRIPDRLLNQFLRGHRIHLPGQSHLISLFEHVRRLKTVAADNAQQALYTEASQLLIKQIMAALSVTTPLSNQADKERVDASRILEMIDSHLSKPMRIPTLARACAMSERTLRRKWMSITGRTLFEEINTRRMERACQLLALPDITIGEVGGHLGIDNPATFSRTFKKKVGITPREYRKNIFENVFESSPSWLTNRTEFKDGEVRQF